MTRKVFQSPAFLNVLLQMLSKYMTCSRDLSVPYKMGDINMAFGMVGLSLLIGALNAVKTVQKYGDCKRVNIQLPKNCGYRKGY